MVTEVIADIFDTDIDVLLQNCNCYCKQASGVAGQIKKFYPEAAEVDRQTTIGDINKLGTFTRAYIKDPKMRRNKRLKWIYNIYGQHRYGTEKRQVNYEAFYQGLEAVKQHLGETKVIIGIPYKIGAGLAGGNWRILKTMIEEVFKDYKGEVFICRRAGD